MKCWYDGLIQLRKGDIVEITNAWITNYGDYTHRVTLMDVVTIGARYYSQYDTNDLSEPILGRVVRSDVRPGARTTFFEIVEGNFEDHVFLRAGEIQKAQDALKEIFTRRIDQYVKIWDPYISDENIKLLSNLGNSITILILTQKIYNINAVKREASKLPNRLIIRKGFKLHDRFILTMGEGWIVGHSLKDFGTKTSQLTKLAASLEAESAFDENWNRAKAVFEK